MPTSGRLTSTMPAADEAVAFIPEPSGAEVRAYEVARTGRIASSINRLKSGLARRNATTKRDTTAHAPRITFRRRPRSARTRAGSGRAPIGPSPFRVPVLSGHGAPRTDGDHLGNEALSASHVILLPR